MTEHFAVATKQIRYIQLLEWDVFGINLLSRIIRHHRSIITALARTSTLLWLWSGIIGVATGTVVACSIATATAGVLRPELDAVSDDFGAVLLDAVFFPTVGAELTFDVCTIPFAKVL